MLVSPLRLFTGEEYLTDKKSPKLLNQTSVEATANDPSKILDNSRYKSRELCPAAPSD